MNPPEMTATPRTTPPTKPAAVTPKSPEPAPAAAPPAPPSPPNPAEPPAPAPLVAAAAATARPIDPDQRYLNRDLSWLEFNRRVLAQATDPRTPLLTRVRFLGIFASNLDEFFMKRVGYIKRQIDTNIATATPDGLTPRPLLFAIRSVVTDLVAEQARCYEQEIVAELAARGVHVLRYA